MKLKPCELEKVKATFQLLSVYDKTDKDNDSFAKFTPGLRGQFMDDPVGKQSKVVFVDFKTPGNLESYSFISHFIP